MTFQESTAEEISIRSPAAGTRRTLLATLGGACACYVYTRTNLISTPSDEGVLCDVPHTTVNDMAREPAVEWGSRTDLRADEKQRIQEASLLLLLLLLAVL
ncbi:thiamine pyrophosphate protein central region [Anopheles sinensis]|uniref:Thiamine pyrophosphate protein central region n=1 Tax=Anopheles sinensis TaxID=74873 RepID=A0A084W4G4_ANOSI|nr:thiamine pyrophosphate protein central region [Anopheles sinensis]